MLKLAEKGAQGIASFPYLSSGSTTGNYYWTQSYDIKGERTADGTYKDGSTVKIPAAAGGSENGLHFYGASRLLSYALDPLPGLDSSGLAMTGGGG